MLWENLREEEFDDAVKKAKGVCIIPMGSIEKHGQHLPLGMDTIAVAEVARIAGECEYAVVFPAMYVGDMIGCRDRGVVSYSPELMLQLLRETCAEIHRNGFEKIVIISGHGGNFPLLTYFQRAAYSEKREYALYCCRLSDVPACPASLLEKNYDYLTDEDKAILQDFVDKNKGCGHACFVETGWTYAIRPETVRLDKIWQEDASSTHVYDALLEKNIVVANWWDAHYPNSYEADPHDGMNERIAKAMLQASVEEFTEQIKCIKNDEISIPLFKKRADRF